MTKEQKNRLIAVDNRLHVLTAKPSNKLVGDEACEMQKLLDEYEVLTDLVTEKELQLLAPDRFKRNPSSTK